MDNDHGITRELRSFTKDPLLGYASQSQHIEQLTAIADRIDEKHRKAMDDSYRDGYQEGKRDGDDEWYEEHESYLEEHGWYQALDADKQPDSYEDMGYLPDFKYVGRSESRDYDPSDVIEYVQLHFEHGYSWTGYCHGVFLVRKDAEKVRTRVLLAAMEDVSDSIDRPCLSTYKLGEAKRIHDSMAEVPPEVESRYADLIERCELIERMEREYQELLGRQRERRAQ